MNDDNNNNNSPLSHVINKFVTELNDIKGGPQVLSDLIHLNYSSPILSYIEKINLANVLLPVDMTQFCTAISNMTNLISFGFGSNRLGDELITKIVMSLSSPKLELLDLGNNLCIQAAISIAQAPMLVNLQTLILAFNQIDDEGLTAIATSPYLSQGTTNLTKLDLAGNKFGSVGIKSLFSSPIISTLEWLDVCGNNIGKDGIDAMVTAITTCNITDMTKTTPLKLTSLALGDCQLCGDAAKSLASIASLLTGLEYLDLSANEIDLKGIKALVESNLFTKLTTLLLSENPIGPEGVSIMALSPSISNVTKLTLNWCDVGDEGAVAIANSPAKFTFLDLHSNAIGLTGITALASSKSLSNLESFGLPNNQLGDDGVKQIANSTAFSSLISINLCRNQIGNDGANALAASPHLGKLDVLQLLGNAGINADVKMRLTTRFPRVQLDFEFGQGFH